MTYVGRITKSGIDVLTATDPLDFIMREDLNTFKILAKGSYSPTLSDHGTAEQYQSLAHGLSISSPFVIAFCKFTSGRVGLPGTKDHANNFWFSNLKSDGTNIKFGYINDTGGDYTPTFKYYICEVPTG